MYHRAARYGLKKPLTSREIANTDAEKHIVNSRNFAYPAVFIPEISCAGWRMFPEPFLKSMMQRHVSGLYAWVPRWHC
jgi:hypothetical protein